MSDKKLPQPKGAPDDVKDEYEPTEEVIFKDGIENSEWAETEDPPSEDSDLEGE